MAFATSLLVNANNTKGSATTNKASPAVSLSFVMPATMAISAFTVNFESDLGNEINVPQSFATSTANPLSTVVLEAPWQNSFQNFSNTNMTALGTSPAYLWKVSPLKKPSFVSSMSVNLTAADGSLTRPFMVLKKPMQGVTVMNAQTLQTYAQMQISSLSRSENTAASMS